MQRIRTVKPEFFSHEGLFDLERETGLPIRLSYCGLWTCCDREGRFKWRPRQLKTNVVPYDECDFSRVLDALLTRGYIAKYTVGDETYGVVLSWHRHQVVNNRESASSIPAPGQELLCLTLKTDDACSTRESREPNATGAPLVHAQVEGKGREGKGKELLLGGATSAPQPVITLTLNDRTEYPISQAEVNQWAQLYQAVNILEELRAMKGWLLANAKNRKTRSGILRFVNRWLSKAQNAAPAVADRAPVRPAAQKSPPAKIEYELPVDVDTDAGRPEWFGVLDSLAKIVNPHSFDCWLKPLRHRVAGVAAGVLLIKLPTPEFRHVGDKWADEIRQALPKTITGVRFIAPTTEHQEA